MKYTTIRIEGAILSADILDKIEQGEIGGQASRDFGFESKVKVKDEIARAWADAQGLWQVFKHQRERVGENVTGTSETRRYWMLPFLGLFGYDPQISRADTVNNKSYAISHRDNSIGGFPVHIMGFRDNLDKRRHDSGPRMSPHALVQEYLNLTEHLFALVTNGFQLRLLRDSSRLIKLSFIEFDLEAMLEDDHYADFAIMYRLIHKSRMPQTMDSGPESLIEKYHQDALDSGSRIRQGLSEAVEKSIVALANGFLKHSANTDLRQNIEDKTLSAGDYYQLMLHLIYRILFLMVIEERHLIYPKNVKNKKRDIYYNYYSVQRLRKLCEKRYLADKRYDDLWIALKQTFRLFEDFKYGRPLDILPLNGELFGGDGIGILSDCDLDNQTLLECLQNLSVFVNRNNGQKMRVNYASLNVEEFGSVYEGLLEYEATFTKDFGNWQFRFVKGSERSASGSHYTPDELVQPLIKHSLDYIIEDKLKERDPESALLSITVCDVACGSGHFLLNAARRIGMELAKIRTGEDQPSPEPLRVAIRDAIQHCIYGVDKNPLAVELCKVALWLEAHNTGEPLNFLDHRVKCGDAIVGLAYAKELENGIANEAFKRLPDDDKEIAAKFRNSNKADRRNIKQSTITFKHEVTERIDSISKLINEFNQLPERTPEQIETKRQKYQEITSGKYYWRLKILADIQTAQFFIPKTEDNEDRLITDAIYRQYLGGQQAAGPAVAMAMSMAQEKRFFHWFLEFPEVFSKGGFDCVLGNPPFLGGQKISGTFGKDYLEYMKFAYAPAGSCDIVTYFYRRIFNVLKSKGFQSLLATNTIAQGGAREGGLDVIRGQGGIINHAVRSMKWPGLAAVEVSLITIYNGKWKKNFVLDQKPVKTISTYLDDSEFIGDPYPLKQNENKSFQGSIVLGKGFILTPEEAHRLIKKDLKNKDVLFPYLNGEDLNSNPDQSPSRWVINFHDWPLNREQDEDEAFEKGTDLKGPPYASDYPDCLKILERLVKPERQRKDENGKFVIRAPMPEKWWIYAEKRPKLYCTITSLERVLVVPLVSKHTAFCFTSINFVYMHKLSVFPLTQYHMFSILKSILHHEWAWKYSSTMGASTLNYSPTDCFAPFPFPQNLSLEFEYELDQIGKNYHEFRRQLMLKMQLGLTKTYNQFHNQQLSEISEQLSVQEITKNYGKQTGNLWKHLEKTPNTCTFNEAVKEIFHLRELHREMDLAVLKAYGWEDIDLAHDFYEVDYLPENDRVRYTIAPEARKEVLKRLLDLNHKIHEEEVAAGLWEKGKKKGVRKKDYNKDQLEL